MKLVRYIGMVLLFFAVYFCNFILMTSSNQDFYKEFASILDGELRMRGIPQSQKKFDININNRMSTHKEINIWPKNFSDYIMFEFIVPKLEFEELESAHLYIYIKNFNGTDDIPLYHHSDDFLSIATNYQFIRQDEYIISVGEKTPIYNGYQEKLAEYDMLIKYDIKKKMSHWLQIARNSKEFNLKERLILGLESHFIKKLTAENSIKKTKSYAQACAHYKTAKCCYIGYSFSVENLRYLPYTILTPKVFNMKFCIGVCTGNQHSTPSSFRFKFVKVVNNRTRDSNQTQPKLCCIPSQFSDLKVIYLNQTSVSVAVLPNFFADDCICT